MMMMNQREKEPRKEKYNVGIKFPEFVELKVFFSQPVNEREERWRGIQWSKIYLRESISVVYKLFLSNSIPIPFALSILNKFYWKYLPAKNLGREKQSKIQG